MSAREMFFVALFRWPREDGRVVYAGEGCPKDFTWSMELDEMFTNESGLVVEIPDALRMKHLLTFAGTWQTVDEHHAENCGCTEPGGGDCEDSVDPDWAWITDGKWRHPTVGDLLRAGIVAPLPLVVADAQPARVGGTESC